MHRWINAFGIALLLAIPTAHANLEECRQNLADALVVTNAVHKLRQNQMGAQVAKWLAVEKLRQIAPLDSIKLGLRQVYPARMSEERLRSYYSDRQPEGRRLAIQFLQSLPTVIPATETSAAVDLSQQLEPQRIETSVAAVMEVLGYLLYTSGQLPRPATTPFEFRKQGEKVFFSPGYSALDLREYRQNTRPWKLAFFSRAAVQDRYRRAFYELLVNRRSDEQARLTAQTAHQQALQHYIQTEQNELFRPTSITGDESITTANLLRQQQQLQGLAGDVVATYQLEVAQEQELSVALENESAAMVFGEPCGAERDLLDLQRVWLATDTLRKLDSLDAEVTKFAKRLDQTGEIFEGDYTDTEAYLADRRAISEFRAFSELLRRNLDQLRWAVTNANHTWNMVFTSHRLANDACNRVQQAARGNDAPPKDDGF